LHLAARQGKGDVEEILVRNGANINEKDVKIFLLEKQMILIKRGREREQRERAERGEESLRESICTSLYFC
jgi:hypothetical protein